MKKIFVALLALCTSYSYGRELHSFESITETLKVGNPVRLLVSFDGCSPKSAVSNLEAFAKVDAVMITPNYIQFANTHLTTSNPHTDGNPILENVTYKLSTDNSVKITIVPISLPDYKPQGTRTLVCNLANGSFRVFDFNSLIGQ